MRTIDEVVDHIFGKRVTGVHDPDFESLMEFYHATIMGVAENSRLQTMSGECARDLLLEMQAIQKRALDLHKLPGEIARELMECAMRCIMSNYQIGVVLGREMEKAIQPEPLISIQ